MIHNVNRRKFFKLLSYSCCGLILPSCTTVPITNRKQLSIYPEGSINNSASKAYENFKTKNKLITTGKQIDTIKDIVTTLGGERYVVIARELTKTFETVHSDNAQNLLEWLEQDPNQLKGEMVLIIEGHKVDANAISAEAIKTLKLLLTEMKPKKACAITAEIHGVKKNALYEIALSFKS